MKKETIFRHELNESIQANAAMNCLKNRNNRKQLNESIGEVYPDSRWGEKERLNGPNGMSKSERDVLIKLEQIIPNLVQKAMTKTAEHDNPEEIKKLVLNMIMQGNLMQKLGNKVGAAWKEFSMGFRRELINLIKNEFAKHEEQEEDVDVYELALEVAQKHARKIARMTEQNACGFLMRELCKLTNRDFDSLDEEGDFDYYQDAALYGYDSVVGYDEEEELDIEGSRAAYYSQDEPDYNDDSHGIRLILNMLLKRGDITKNDIPRVQKQIKSMLDEEGMWIGDDDHEAERFIEMLWDNQEQEESADDAEEFISDVVNLMEDEGMIDDSQWDAAYYTVEEMVQSNPELLHYPSYMQFLNVFGDDILSKLNNQEQEELPQMERHDMILALTQYLDESWIDDIEDGDLDELYYAVAKVLDKTGDYPASTNWEDCKPWCEKHHGEVVETFLGGGF